MAGMFYSLKETAERLGVTEEQVKQLAKDGKLREFRDGSNLLFKIEEVNALAAEEAELPVGDLELSDSAAAELPAEIPEDQATPTLDDSLEEDIFKLDEEEAPAAESDTTTGLEPAADSTGEETAGVDLTAEPSEEASEADLAADATGEETSGLDLAAESTGEETSGLDLLAEAASDEASGLDLAADSEGTADTTGTDDLALLEEEQPSAEGSSEEISLAAESDVLAAESDITDMDTALTGEGVNVLSESDVDYQATDDSMAETAGPASSSAEASLEEIEDDVNLDSFGSGSGLLDLSLQADDTSLGGILDEIYTAEGGEEKPGAEGEEEGEGLGEPASFDELTAEADHAAAEEETTMPEPVAAIPTAAISPVFAETAPDSQSNILGMLLFLPLLALLYTAIVTVAALPPWQVRPSLLTSVQGVLWYVLGAGIVLALIVVGASFVVGAEKAPKAAKSAREKKVKVRAEKPAKEKKEKPTKEKKSFFGKKK
jgi:excisionase family DNA binding protein